MRVCALLGHTRTHRQGGRSIVDLMRPFLDACGLDVPTAFSVRVRADMKLAYGHVVPEEAAEAVAASGACRLLMLFTIRLYV
jgi:hypothetical protein